MQRATAAFLAVQLLVRNKGRVVYDRGLSGTQLALDRGVPLTLNGLLMEHQKRLVLCQCRPLYRAPRMRA